MLAVSASLVNERELEAGKRDALGAFLQPSANQSAIARKAIDLANRGHGRGLALYNPAIAYVIDASLDTLLQPEVQAKLPRASFDRERIAVEDIVPRIVDDAHKNGHVIKRYRSDTDIVRGLTPDALDELLSEMSSDNTLVRFGCGPFEDIGQVGRGAKRFLTQNSISPRMHAAIITTSHNLNRSFTRFHDRNRNDILGHLADPTSTTLRADCFTFANNTASDLSLKFTDATREYLDQKSIQDGGCPASRTVVEVAGRHTNLSGATWRKISTYLFS